jgi:hypothetical protein
MSGSAAAKVLHAGRSCPIDYTYSPAALARAPDFDAETLYVAGGLYGNLDALGAIEQLAAVEQATLVFNGDFHWLDADPDWFARIERGVGRHRATRGNVETEIARAVDIGAGCGCAYPDTVAEDVVQRSNEILAILREYIPATARTPLYSLPQYLVARVGALRIGIVHGDATSVAGWSFAHNELDRAANKPELSRIRAQTNIDVFACTHTGHAALRDFALPGGRLTIINNGAAGMPNFAGTTFGVITRIAATPSPHNPLYGLQRDGLYIDALAVRYDQRAFFDRFLKRWPQGSPAHISYCGRIGDGPDYNISQARPR